MKLIDGFKGYLVTKTGQIWSHKTQKFLSPARSQNGYYNVALYVEGARHTVSVHRVVAAAFLPTWNYALQVNHIDGDKSNNCISNLEMVTGSENKKHAFRIGLINQSGERNPISKLDDAKVREIRINIYKLSDTAFARKWGLNTETIRQVRLGNNWKHVLV